MNLCVYAYWFDNMAYCKKQTMPLLRYCTSRYSSQLNAYAGQRDYDSVLYTYTNRYLMGVILANCCMQARYVFQWKPLMNWTPHAQTSIIVIARYVLGLAPRSNCSTGLYIYVRTNCTIDVGDVPQHSPRCTVSIGMHRALPTTTSLDPH